MFPINLKAACGVWCALVLCAAAEDTTPPKVDHIDVVDAWAREHRNSTDHASPYHRMSPEMDALDRSKIKGLGAEDLAKMSLDNSLLKYSYADVFLTCMGPFEQLDPQQERVLADMRRRGDAVSPILLKLMTENQETQIEISIPTGLVVLGRFFSEFIVFL